MILTLTKKESYETQQEVTIDVPAIYKDSTDWLYLVTTGAIVIVSQYGISIYKKDSVLFERYLNEVLTMERTDDINAFMKLYQHVSGSIIISINANKARFLNQIINK